MIWRGGADFAKEETGFVECGKYRVARGVEFLLFALASASRWLAR